MPFAVFETASAIRSRIRGHRPYQLPASPADNPLMDTAQSDIAADFLVEADEIVARLGEQLVQLEHAPGDTELLNAIFRGFHTIKGGASFLDFGPMVELCHGVEELFDLLRRGQR